MCPVFLRVRPGSFMRMMWLCVQIVQAKTPFDEEPLFLYLAHQAVHAPTGPAPWGKPCIPEVVANSSVTKRVT